MPPPKELRFRNPKLRDLPWKHEER